MAKGFPDEPVYPWTPVEGAPGCAVAREGRFVVLNFGAPVFRLELDRAYAVKLAVLLANAAGARSVDVEL